MEVVYSLRRHPFAEGRVYQNPRHFTGPIKDAKHVYIEGDFTKVAAAYKRAGVTVTELGPLGPAERAKTARAAKTEPSQPEA